MSHRKIFMKQVRSFQAGNIVFNEGDAWDGLYCIQSGKVTVYKTQKTSDGPKAVELAELGPGSLIGEMGLFEKTRRDATVKALEYTEMLIITREMFEEQMSKVPPWMVNIFKLLTQRLRVTNERYMETLQKLAGVEGALGQAAEAVGKSASEAISAAKASRAAPESKIIDNPFAS